MRRILFLVVPLCAALLAQGAWYWPFGSKEDDPSKPLRLHRLLEEANNYIELAEEEAMKGNGDKALENYRLALGELDRVERENPERAETAEFSPLRNKRAACVAAMDAIRFAQVNDNERAVSVTDTRELQKKWNKKHGIKDPEEDKGADAAPKAPSVPKDTKPSEPPKDVTADFRYRLKMAIAEVRNKDYVAADILLEELLREKPGDLNLHLLRAGAQAGMGSHYAARRTLEKAVRAYPKSYLPHYNMANLSLQMGEDSAIARKYYEKGRAVGGPPQPELEAKLNAGKSQSK